MYEIKRNETKTDVEGEAQVKQLQKTLKEKEEIIRKLKLVKSYKQRVSDGFKNILKLIKNQKMFGLKGRYKKHR